MFADDSKCYRVIETPQDTELLQSDLHSLCKWSTTSDLNFTLKKCTSIRFSRKRTKKSPDYNLNHQQITITSTQKDLGIIISNNLKWTPHISNIVSKANQMLGFLRRNCTNLTDIKCRRLLYLTLVRAHLCYGSEIWAPQSTSRDLLRIESVQRRSTKYVLQDYHSSYTDRLKLLNLLPISYWYEIKDIISFYKMKSGIYDLNPENYVDPPPSQHLTPFSSTISFRPNLCRTTSFRSSFFNRIVPLWNSLPEELKLSNSTVILKTKLKNHYQEKLKTVFDVDRPRTWKTICSKCRSCVVNCCS